MNGLKVANKRGKVATWRWNQKNGKLSRGAARGGIDWWRYYKEVLQPKLIPYAQQLEAFLNNRGSDISDNDEFHFQPPLPAPSVPPPVPPLVPEATNIASSSRQTRSQSRHSDTPPNHPAIQRSLVPIPDVDDPPAILQRVWVQEDKAPAHNHRFQERVYKLADIQRLLWPGNSPDLNMIEPYWFWLKVITSKYGAPTTKEDAAKRWIEAWQQLLIQRIRV
jgi:hypothetical protein